MAQPVQQPVDFSESGNFATFRDHIRIPAPALPVSCFGAGGLSLSICDNVVFSFGGLSDLSSCDNSVLLLSMCDNDVLGGLSDLSSCDKTARASDWLRFE